MSVAVSTQGRLIKEDVGLVFKVKLKLVSQRSSHSGVMGSLKERLGKRDCARALESPIKVF